MRRLLDENTGTVRKKMFKETTKRFTKFDFISVKRKSGVEICKEKFNVTAEWVLDPVFVCDSKNMLNYPKITSEHAGKIHWRVYA